jgi:hypothetical protein
LGGNGPANPVPNTLEKFQKIFSFSLLAFADTYDRTREKKRREK